MKKLEEIFYKNIINNINKEMVFNSLNINDLSRESGISLVVLRDRFKEPGKLKIRELYQIAEVLKVSVKDLMR